MLFILLQKVGLTSYTITLIGLQLFEPFLCALCCLFKCQLLMALKCWIMIENDKQLQWLAGKNQYLFFPLINAQETGCRWRTRDEVFWLLLVDKKLFPLFTFQRYGFPGVYFSVGKQLDSCSMSFWYRIFPHSVGVQISSLINPWNFVWLILAWML